MYPITRLSITWKEPRPIAVVLPHGSDVRLQHLVLWSKDNTDYVDEVRHLQDAIHLTFIQFHHTYAQNLEDGWPMCMSKLRVVKGERLPFGPPSQLVGYPLLRHLDLSSCYFGSDYTFTLPSWLSQLTQLETLNLCGSCLKEFPVCLMELKQLCSLDLSQNCFNSVALPEEFTQFSEFSALTCLNLTCCWSPHSINSGHASQQLSGLNNVLAPGILWY